VPTEEEISKVVELWDLGKSYSEIANQLNNKPRSTVQGWIESLIKIGRIVPRTNGVHTNTKNAHNARKTYTRERRLALNDAFYEKICDMMKDVDKPSGLRDLAVSYGIIEDKRSLIEPLQTVNENDLLTKFTDALDNHAISAQTSRCLPRLPEDSANPDVRVGEKR
jgi:hypothetical protein